MLQAEHFVEADLSRSAIVRMIRVRLSVLVSDAPQLLHHSGLAFVWEQAILVCSKPIASTRIPSSSLVWNFTLKLKLQELVQHSTRLVNC